MDFLIVRKKSQEMCTFVVSVCVCEQAAQQNHVRSHIDRMLYEYGWLCMCMCMCLIPSEAHRWSEKREKKIEFHLNLPKY